MAVNDHHVMKEWGKALGADGKIDFLVAEHGEAISVMRSIKQALDPHDIMNPGKIVRL